jgi:hypothetical protein
VYQWCGFESRWGKNNKKFVDFKEVVIRSVDGWTRQLNDRENMVVEVALPNGHAYMC